MSSKKNEKILVREKSPTMEKPPSTKKKLPKAVTSREKSPLTKKLPSVKKLPKIPKLKTLTETLPTPTQDVLLYVKKKTSTSRKSVATPVTPGSPASSVPTTIASPSSSRAKSLGSSVSSTPRKKPDQEQRDDEK